MNQPKQISDDTSLDAAVPSQSRYLTKEDVGEDGKNVTIAGCTRDVLDEHTGEIRTVLHFKDHGIKPMVLNKTNTRRLQVILEADTVGEIKGRTVNVYNDPMIEFGGKIVGGIRIRKMQPESPADSVKAAIANAATTKQLQGEPDDDIPF